MLKQIKNCYENIFDQSEICSCDSKTIYGIHTIIKKLQNCIRLQIIANSNISNQINKNVM